MNDETIYTISTLADAVGVTPRTIRYYTAEGLLPPPDTRGKYALYSAEHLLRLRLIAYLKDAYLPLGEIRSQLEPLSLQELQKLLDEFETEAAPQAPGSAADYIGQVLARQATVPQRMAEANEHYQAPTMAAPAMPATPPAAAPPIDTGAALPQVPASAVQQADRRVTPAPAQEGLLSRLLPRRREQMHRSAHAPAATEERWQRITLAPGIELHVREPQSASIRERVERLIAQAHELFSQ